MAYDATNGVVLNESRYYQPMIESLNAANVTVYAVNLQRNAPEVPAYHQTLDRLSAQTNGEYFRRPVNFEPVVKKIEEEFRGRCVDLSREVIVLQGRWREIDDALRVRAADGDPIATRAFVVAAVVCFLLTVSGSSVVLGFFTGWAPQTVVDTVASFSFISHFPSVMRGVLDIKDMVYFLSLIAFFLFANTAIVELKKAD